MKYLIVLVLFMSGCSWSEKDKCEFGNGSRALIGLPLFDCSPVPKKVKPRKGPQKRPHEKK